MPRRIMPLTVCLLGTSLLAAGTFAQGKDSKDRKNGAQQRQSVTVDMHAISTSGIGRKIGTVRITDGPRGASFDVNVSGIQQGRHGFHVHQNGSCEAGESGGKPTAGAAAGGHFDPDNTATHKGPSGTGHKGDLPAINAKSGATRVNVVAPRLRVSDILGRSLIIHEGGDTYSDTPELGGGGARIACGVIPNDADRVSASKK